MAIIRATQVLRGPKQSGNFLKNTGQLTYVQTRLRANSRTLCELAYVGEFASRRKRLRSTNFSRWQRFYTLGSFTIRWRGRRENIGLVDQCSNAWFHVIVNSQRSVSLKHVRSDVTDSIFHGDNTLPLLAEQTHFTQLWETTNSHMMVIKFAYVGEFTSRRRRVGVGEFTRRRVDRIPFLKCRVQFWKKLWCRVGEQWNTKTWYQTNWKESIYHRKK